MKRIKTVDDVYAGIEELVDELKNVGYANLATILDHRMHRVAWTSRSELFDELNNVLRDAVELQQSTFPTTLKLQVQRIVNILQQVQ